MIESRPLQWRSMEGDTTTRGSRCNLSRIIWEQPKTSAPATDPSFAWPAILLRWQVQGVALGC